MFAKEMTVSVDATPEAVYTYVSQIGRHPEWAAQKLTIRETEDGRYESIWRMGFRAVHAHIAVESQEPPHRFVYLCDDEVSGQYRWHFDITPSGTGSKVRFGLERLGASRWVKVVQPLLLWPTIGRPGVRTGLANIKRVVESSASAGG